MHTQMTFQRLIRLVFVLLLLTACGDVSDNGINIDSNIAYWPENLDYYAEKTFFDQVTVESHTRFRLEAVNGRIDIVGESGGDKVVVTAALRVGSDSHADAQEGLDMLDVRITVSTDEIFIQTLQPQGSFGRQYTVDYTITVPSDLSVETNHVNGNAIISDIQNSISVYAVNGDVDLSEILGDATASVDNGHIDAKISLPLNGEIRLSSENGDIDLHIPKTTSAELSALVDTGTIDWDQLELTVTLHTKYSLSGTLGDGTGVIDLDTINGDISITGFNG